MPTLQTREEPLAEPLPVVIEWLEQLDPNDVYVPDLAGDCLLVAFIREWCPEFTRVRVDYSGYVVDGRSYNTPAIYNTLQKRWVYHMWTHPTQHFTVADALTIARKLLEETSA